MGGKQTAVTGNDGVVFSHRLQRTGVEDGEQPTKSGLEGAQMALTDTGARKAKAKGKAYRLSDGGGLYLWMTPTGGKLWRWKYRHEGGEKRMSFGKYPACRYRWPEIAIVKHENCWLQA
jgi:hypothetical protein